MMLVACAFIMDVTLLNAQTNAPATAPTTPSTKTVVKKDADKTAVKKVPSKKQKPTKIKPVAKKTEVAQPKTPDKK